ncbi:MAG TPA: cell division protein ZapA [Treponemataceae bacterium]|jgi:cell division protein ZapA|nr:cell division protein ZapA [Treponemataceae bacterium]
MAKGSLQIDVLGASFAIQADEKPEYLAALYSHYRKTVSQIEASAGVANPLKTAIIAGILIADELFKEKMRNASSTAALDLAEAERMALKMISRIDQVISE